MAPATVRPSLPRTGRAAAAANGGPLFGSPALRPVAEPCRAVQPFQTEHTHTHTPRTRVWAGDIPGQGLSTHPELPAGDKLNIHPTCRAAGSWGEEGPRPPPSDLRGRGSGRQGGGRRGLGGSAVPGEPVDGVARRRAAGGERREGPHRRGHPCGGATGAAVRSGDPTTGPGDDAGAQPRFGAHVGKSRFGTTCM